MTSLCSELHVDVLDWTAPPLASDSDSARFANQIKYFNVELGAEGGHYGLTSASSDISLVAKENGAATPISGNATPTKESVMRRLFQRAGAR